MNNEIITEYRCLEQKHDIIIDFKLISIMHSVCEYDIYAYANDELIMQRNGVDAWSHKQITQEDDWGLLDNQYSSWFHWVKEPHTRPYLYESLR